MAREIVKFKSKSRRKPEYTREEMGDFDVDLNTASYHQLVVIPMLGRERARVLLEARPFTRWEQVRHLPDFNDQVVEDLRKGGARIRKAA